MDWTKLVQNQILLVPAVASHYQYKVIFQLYDTFGWTLIYCFVLQDSKGFSTNSNTTVDTDSTEIPYEKYLVSTPEANLSNFVEMAEICPSTSQENSTQKTTDELMHVLPVKNGPNFVCVDRNTVISRYKEKRKARRWVKYKLIVLVSWITQCFQG